MAVGYHHFRKPLYIYIYCIYRKLEDVGIHFHTFSYIFVISNGKPFLSFEPSKIRVTCVACYGFFPRWTWSMVGQITGWKKPTILSNQWLGSVVVSICCSFSPDPSENDPVWLAHTFQMGWFNHQLDGVVEATESSTKLVVTGTSRYGGRFQTRFPSPIKKHVSLIRISNAFL